MSDAADFLCKRLGVRRPLLQAPMAGSSGVNLAVAVNDVGGLGSLPCAMLSETQIRAQVAEFRARTKGPINLNFFAHTEPTPDPARDAAWAARLQPYINEFGLGTDNSATTARTPFSDALCALVEEFKPEVVSFHFGLPSPEFVARVKKTGAAILSSATTVDEARFLEAHGCDAIIAQGFEAGGHRGMFLSDDISTQIGTMALVPLIASSVRIPVIASGGIADARGVAAAFALGASAVQIGTAFLRCPECDTAPLHRAVLAIEADTVLTNIFTGRPARGIVNRFMREQGPINPDAPHFPGASQFLAPIRKAAEAKGSNDFSPLWVGQAYPLCKEASARAVVEDLMGDFA